MRTMRLGWLAVAVVAVLGFGQSASAQVSLGGLTVEGDVEAGVRAFIERPSKSERAKFEEYRDLSPGLFLQELRLRIFRPDESYSSELTGSKWGREDQEFGLRTGRLGLWELGFEWDQMRHIFSTNARTLATETSRGVFTLPTPRPAVTAYNAGRELDEISTRWDTARMFFRITPTPDLALTAEYTRTRKEGDRPMRVAFGFNFLEVVEPIDQTVHDLRLQGAIARERWQLQFGYTFSLFENSVRSLTANNPFSAVDGAFAAASRSSTPSAGRVSLPPDNMAHTFNVAGGASLPWWRTRVTSNLSYSLRLQNDEFLPHTRNPVLLANGGPGLVLPEKSLNGNVQVFLVNLNATSRPLTPLTLSAKYRLYDYEDLSDQITFPNLVETDTTIQPSRRAGRWSYRRQNADLDARWQIIQPAAFTLGTGWERSDRNEHREVPASDEFSGKAVLDLTPLDWLLVKLKYVPSLRRISRYDTRAHAEHSTVEEETTSTQGQSLLLRKFDEAERDRHRADLLVQLAPFDVLTVSPTVGYRHDDYIKSKLGLQNDITWSAGLDVTWTPWERVSLSAGYMHESIFQQMRSRSRPVPTPPNTAAADFPDFDWISDNTDTVETFYAAVKATLIPNVLDWTFSGNYSTALGRIETRNPVAPVGSAANAGNAAAVVSARAKPTPAFEDSLLRLETALRYQVWKNWTASLRYVFESFEKTDWRTDALNPFVPRAATAASGGIWLGNDLKNYTSHLIGVTLAYRFR